MQKLGIQNAAQELLVLFSQGFAFATLIVEYLEIAAMILTKHAHVSPNCMHVSSC